MVCSKCEAKLRKVRVYVRLPVQGTHLRNITSKSLKHSVCQQSEEMML